ncbi:MAG: twin-arginine translocase TatA/TatE family subunit [Gemmatimonadetes bacterium]|nr:MAG: twin-arginine translocase TatA/TatE family subunit [Gemmatimonadota bacterium]
MGFGSLGPGELILIFLVVLLLFGAKRLPEIGSSLGKGIREFKSSVREIEREIQTPPETRGTLGAAPPAETPHAAEGAPATEERSDDDGEPRRLTTS